MTVTVLPVAFRGLEWAHPGHKHGRKWRPAADLPDRMRMYEEQLEDVEIMDMCTLDGEEDEAEFLRLAEQADVVVPVFAELLSVIWAVKALEKVTAPIVFHGGENRPSCPLVDAYGCLYADGRDVRLALNMADLQTILRAIGAKKKLANTRALVIGDAYPSWSQVANPSSAEMVRDKLGVELIHRSIDDLFDEFGAVEDADAQVWVDKWLAGATEVTDAARNDILEAAKVYLACKKMIAEAEANAFTVECRTWDEETMERFGRFFGPCMGLTTLRWEGIPAACEADLCAMLSMCTLTYVSGLPAFMGNIGSADAESGRLQVGTHAAATVNMEGEGDKLEGYRLDDYGGRETGLSSYVPVASGKDVTIARFDKNLSNISLATGTTAETDRYFEVILSDVEDFVHRCLVGDHYAVVYGSHVQEVRLLMEMLGVGVLEPGVAGRCS